MHARFEMLVVALTKNSETRRNVANPKAVVFILCCHLPSQLSTDYRELIRCIKGVMEEDSIQYLRVYAQRS